MVAGAANVGAAARAATAGNATNPPTNPPAAHTNVTVSVMDTFVPVIVEPSADAIEAKFPHKTLTKIEGEPTYNDFHLLREESFRNALSSKSPFGGGNHGHKGACTTPITYTIETGGAAWNVPATQGVFPTFPPGATDDEKRIVIAEFVRDEMGIKTADVTVNLLRNQLLEAVDEEYYMELYDDVFRYDRVSPSEFLDHILTCYAELDDETLEKNKKEFDEPPDMSKPIDVYYRKQERCMKLATDGAVPINESEMVQKLQIHMGQTGIINSAYTKWKRKTRAERRWATGKAFFRKAIKEAEKINKLTGDGDFSANALVTNTQETVRNEMVEQMGEAFDNLALAATFKNDKLDSMVKAIAELTAANATLTKANYSLTQQLAKCQIGNTTRNTNRNDGSSGNDAATGSGTKPDWPPWSDPKAYCHSCGYKLRKGHTSATCPKAKLHPGHKKDATRQNPMGGSLKDAGWGHTPNGNERQ